MASSSRARNTSSLSPSRSPSPKKEKHSTTQARKESLSASSERLLSQIQALSDEQVEIQKRTFTRWINFFLKKHKTPMKVDDLLTDLKDGICLIALLEVLSGERILREKGHKRLHHLANVGHALEFLKTRNVRLVSIHQEAIVDCNSTITLGLVWAIIHHFQVEGFYATKTKARGKKFLFQWAQQAAQKAGTGSGEEIKDFGKSWRTGQAFMYLIHAYRPELINIEGISERDNKTNLQEAFDIASEKLNVPRLLEPEDVDVDKPDERSIMTYVAALCDSLGETSSKKARDTAAAERAVRQPGKRTVKDVALAASAKKTRDTNTRSVSPTKSDSSRPSSPEKSPDKTKRSTLSPTPGDHSKPTSTERVTAKRRVNSPDTLEQSKKTNRSLHSPEKPPAKRHSVSPEKSSDKLSTKRSSSTLSLSSNGPASRKSSLSPTSTEKRRKSQAAGHRGSPPKSKKKSVVKDDEMKTESSSSESEMMNKFSLTSLDYARDALQSVEY